MTFLPGQVISDKYRIEKMIGQGAYGEVYLVTHLGLHVLRAVKLLRRDAPGIGSTDFNNCQRRFQLEAELGARLNTPKPNPHLLQVFNFERKDELLLLEMEYAPGGNLAERIRSAREKWVSLPVEAVVQLGVELAGGLAAMHKLDVVHRDVKPNNILFDEDGHARLADLGLAQVAGGPSLREELSQPAPHPGTPGYMSPEQERSGRPLKPSSDVYSLGIVLFEALTGRNYGYLKPGTRLRDLRSETPAWLDELLGRMLSEDTKDRPWDGAEVAALLKKGLEQEARGESKHMHPAGRQKWIIGLGVLALVALSVIGVARLFPPGVANEPTTTKPPLTQAQSPSAVPFDTEIPIPTELSNPTNAPIPTSTIVITPVPSLAIGSTWTRPADGMVMVYIPEGDFMMGSPEGIGAADEHPQHSVFLNSFWIDKTEVTNAMYSLCVQAGDCLSPILSESASHPVYYGKPEFDDYPVIYVDWTQADAYCRWAKVHLPTEAEWEKAARATSGRSYPWGDSSPTCLLANYLGCVGDTTRTGSHPTGASQFLVLDMAGNVWEWVSDWYNSGYYNFQALKNNPPGPPFGDERVIRGGSWDNVGTYIRSATRYSFDPNKSVSSIGFRCARSAN